MDLLGTKRAIPTLADGLSGELSKSNFATKSTFFLQKESATELFAEYIGPQRVHDLIRKPKAVLLLARSSHAGLF